MGADPNQLLTAFLVGLMGGVHCVGMCGGIVGALTLSLPGTTSILTARMLFLVLAYNAGRVTSYVAAGMLVGGVGYLAAHLTELHSLQLGLSLAAGLLMVALGLYLGGWWFGIAHLENAGARLWRWLEPYGRRFVPVATPARAFGLGLVWGWLPCGLVYSVLIWTLAAGSAQAGGLLMLSFGLGTLPTLLLLGVVATRLTGFVRQRWVRSLAGLMVIGFGVLQIWRSVA